MYDIAIIGAGLAANDKRLDITRSDVQPFVA